jgi:hypothetical protein
MRGVQRAMERFPDRRQYISLSLHCETAEIMAAYTKLVQQEGRLSGLRAYSAARPPHSEGLAIAIAAYLAHETDCVNINLLHLSSRKAVEAALIMAKAFPHIDFRREVTCAHLVHRLRRRHRRAGQGQSADPFARGRGVPVVGAARRAHRLGVFGSCVLPARNEGGRDAARGDLRRQIGLRRHGISAVRPDDRGPQARPLLQSHGGITSRNPAQRFGLLNKGDIAPGYDADLAIVDPAKSFVVRAADSESTQGYSPFEGSGDVGPGRGDVSARRRPSTRTARRRRTPRPLFATPIAADGHGAHGRLISRILFARKPQGLPVPEDFTRGFRAHRRNPPGQFLVRNLYLAIEPYYRNVMKGMALYGKPLQPGDVMFGETLSQVVVSRHDGFAVGDLVVARGGWQDYAVLDGAAVRKVPTARRPRRRWACSARRDSRASSASCISRRRGPARPWWCRRPRVPWDPRRDKPRA